MGRASLNTTAVHDPPRRKRGHSNPTAQGKTWPPLPPSMAADRVHVGPTLASNTFLPPGAHPGQTATVYHDPVMYYAPYDHQIPPHHAHQDAHVPPMQGAAVALPPPPTPPGHGYLRLNWLPNNLHLAPIRCHEPPPRLPFRLPSLAHVVPDPTLDRAHDEAEKAVSKRRRIEAWLAEVNHSAHVGDDRGVIFS